MKTSVVALLLWAGCTKPNPALSCEDGLCSDPNVPFCDVTGSIGGEPNTCVHVSCTPNAFEECRGDKALTCNSAGNNYDLLTCSQGCSAETNGCKPEPPCETLDCKKHIIPKYLPTECDSLAPNGALTIDANTMLDTSVDTNCTRIVQQTSGPDICVLHYASVSIQLNRTLKVVGTRALALVADQDLLVDGVLDVGPSPTSGGPGGGLLSSGGPSTLSAAGGGAGYRTTGGAGGSSTTGGGGVGGAVPAQNPTQLSVLLGGYMSTGPFNNAGGAATLISCRGAAIVKGIIDAAGGGGVGGQVISVGGVGRYVQAQGGGAAGTVAVQGLTLAITGQLYANGGGGGGGGDGGSTGTQGQRSTGAAAGGTPVGTGGVGGAGGALGAPLPGGGDSSSSRGGGGGGAAGYLLIYSPGSSADVVTPLTVSPAIEAKGIVATN